MHDVSDGHLVAVELYDSALVVIEDLRRERGALRQQLAESRAALAKYGAHDRECCDQWRPGSADCTCGLAIALAATTPTAGGS